jgi:diacylglycerol kinase (ATP)
MKTPGRSPNRLAAFANALRGTRVFFAGQASARIHLVASVVVVALGLGLHVSTGEWLALVLAMALVLTAEALNTALELAVDLASPDWHALARDAKDVAAAAVLLASLGALVVGLLVFVPKV